MVLLFCVVVALFASSIQEKHVKTKYSSTDTEQSKNASVQESVGLEATIPFQKIVFGTYFDFINPEIIRFTKVLIPVTTQSLFLNSYFREILLHSMPSMAP